MFQAVCRTCQIYHSLLWYPLLDPLLNIPILIPVQESREDTVQICACANKEEDDEQERLEFEDAELDDYVVSM